MKIDWAEVRQTLVLIFRPSLAKALSLPLLVAGIAILSEPLWLDALNYILSKQEIIPNFKGPITTPEDYIGWIFIALSVFIFLVDSYRQFKTIDPINEDRILEAITQQPEITATLLVEKFRAPGFLVSHLQDEKINNLVNEITLLRFFKSFQTEEKAIALADSILNGELFGGTPPVKAKALAMLARYLSVDRYLDASQYLKESKKLSITQEAEVAQAFIDAYEVNSTEPASILLNSATPSNYGAFLIIKRKIEGDDAAIGWFADSQLNIRDLNDEGKFSLIATLLSAKEWIKALDVVRSIDNPLQTEFPALIQVCAFTFLTNAVKAVELRESVMQQVPLAADKFPLADDPISISLRRRSSELFRDCAKLAENLGAMDVSDFSNHYALWLELRDSDIHENSMKRLRSYFVKYTQNTLEYLPLAFAFGVQIDYESIEREIDRQTALTNNSNPILGIARFVLAQVQDSYPKTLEYINTHRVQLEKHVNPVAIHMLEVEVLARSGLIDDAEELVKSLETQGVPIADIANLNNLIGMVKGKDPVALAIAHYEETQTVTELNYAVNLLEKTGLNDKFYQYCKKLFDRTGQELDAIRVCNAAAAAGQFDELHQFLISNTELVQRSTGLQIHKAWSLFRKGDLLESKKQILLLRQSNSNEVELQKLEINLAIYSGDWEALNVFIEKMWRERESLGASDLLQAALLAKAISPSRAKQVLEFAANKYPEEPELLASAYFTATTMGWEDNQEISAWLNKAVVLSTEDGPLRPATLQQLKDIITESRQRNDQIYKAYENSTAPVFTVMELLNRTMSDFYLIQPIENIKELDVRRKKIMAIINGVRPEHFISGHIIALDRSSSLVIGLLGLLNHLFDFFEKIVIPHSFMRWLYEEKQKVSFHQPSQITRAKKFEKLVSDARIYIFHPKKAGNPELSIDVGEDLACMLEQASSAPANESAAYVVCSYQFYKLEDSFREIEIDLSAYSDHLISCSQLIKKVNDLGVITEDQCSRALKYLSRHEKEWPGKLEIKEGAVLYLDSLSITHLMTTDMLERIAEAGFKIYAHKDEREKYKRLISFDLAVVEAGSMLENIRKVFCNGINQGKVILAEMPLIVDRSSTDPVGFGLPSEEILEMLKVCDDAIIDDRFFNRHEKIIIGDRSVRIHTSLDFVESLYQKEIITVQQKFDFKSALRDSGFSFISIDPEELNFHLTHSPMVSGEFKPTKQLRALKENFFLLRISGLVQLPRDAQWLHETMKKMTQGLKNLWSADSTPEQCWARSSWLYELLDFRGWAQYHEIRGSDGMATLGELIRISSILIVPDTLSVEKKIDYKKWLDTAVLTPLKELDSYSYNNLIKSVKSQMDDFCNLSILGDADVQN